MSNMVLSPSDIEFLLHCYYSPVGHPRIDSHAITEAIALFLNFDMIYRVEDSYVFNLTEKGEAHVRQLCDLPLPRKAFIDGNGNVIGDICTTE